MKQCYPVFLKVTLLLLLTTGFVKGHAQLAKGSLAFTGYIGNGVTGGTDEFSFVVLTSIPAGTTVKFTENGWLRTSATTGSFRTGEGTLQWVSTALPAGAEVRIVCSATPTATLAPMGTSAGTVTILAATEGNGTAPALSANGDQIIAYQGSSASPTFITAIHMNVYSVALNPAPGVPGGDGATTTVTDWEGSFSNAVTSGLPSGTGSNFLTTGVDAIWIPGVIAAEVDNARFNNCGTSLVTPAQVRTALYNVANWTTSNDAPGFTLPTNCPYLGLILPVRLLGFQAQNRISEVLLRWKVTNESDMEGYDVERSYDNQNFVKIAGLSPLNQGGDREQNYAYTDREALNTGAQTIYYRIRLNDRDGKNYYSETAVIRNNKNASFLVNNLTNPVQGELRFTVFTRKPGQVSILLTDANGKIYISRTTQLSAGDNAMVLPEAAPLAKGIYYLRIATNEQSIVNKLVK